MHAGLIMVSNHTILPSLQPKQQEAASGRKQQASQCATCSTHSSASRNTTFGGGDVAALVSANNVAAVTAPLVTMCERARIVNFARRLHESCLQQGRKKGTTVSPLPERKVRSSRHCGTTL